jgi:hypothetical protein
MMETSAVSGSEGKRMALCNKNFAFLPIGRTISTDSNGRFSRMDRRQALTPAWAQAPVVNPVLKFFLSDFFSNRKPNFYENLKIWEECHPDPLLV